MVGKIVTALFVAAALSGPATADLLGLQVPAVADGSRAAGLPTCC